MMYRYYIKLAFMRFSKGPGTAFLIIVTLAIGMSSCMTAMAIFSAFEGEAIPGVSSHLHVITMNADEAVTKNGSNNTKPNNLLKIRDAEALLNAHSAPSGVAVAASYTRVNSPDRKQSMMVNGLLSYGPVVKVFGVPLRFGRSWTVEEQRSHAPLAIIGSDLAEHIFGVKDAVGKSIVIGGHYFKVIGVAGIWKPRLQFVEAPQFEFPIGLSVELFLPVEAALDAGAGPLLSGECGVSAANKTYGSVDVKSCRWLETWVTLDTSASINAYQHLLTSYSKYQSEAGRFIGKPLARLYSSETWINLNHVVPDDVSLNVILSASFLLLCMTNVIGVLSARFLHWRADAVVRLALGASRRQLLEQHLVESALLGLLGGGLALPLTLLGLLMVRMQPVGYADAARFSPTVFLALVVLSLAVGIVVGIFPAWRLCRMPLALQIKRE